MSRFRRSLRSFTLALPGLFLLGASACSGEASRPATAEGLKGLLSDLTQARSANDVAKAARLTKGLLPDEARVKKGLAASASAADVQKVLDFHKPFRAADEAQLAGLLNPGNPKRTEIQVHGATGAEIAANQGIVAAEFPGGAVSAAKSGLLRQDLTYYEVEFVEPGQDKGMKFHLFFHDGSGWAMLGKVW